MDRITQSLQTYLKSAKIPYKTIFNAESGAIEEESTSTVIHIQNPDDVEEVIDIVIDVYPEDGNFNIEAYPRYVFTEKYLAKVRTLENKWNRSGMFTSLIVEEEDGVVEPDCYSFHILLRGFSDPSGMTEYLWSRYLKEAEDSAWLAWNKIVATICNFGDDL